MLGERAIRRMGFGCLLLAIAFWSVSLALGCARLAAWVGAFSLLDGAVFGLMLALVTRTRRPLLIYLCLVGAGLTFWPLFAAWPPADSQDVHLWPTAPNILYTYFDVFRFCLFTLGIPTPFARLGYHAPDAAQKSPET